ncbi:MAG: hypothetical protein FWE53_02570 [Firmicutes bacterium]|nr:hypothetical protein [Bacillota bacterium]
MELMDWYDANRGKFEEVKKIVIPLDTIERKCYASGVKELGRHSLGYDAATPISPDLGIGVNEYVGGQSGEYTRDVGTGYREDCAVYLYPGGGTYPVHPDGDDVGFRPCITLDINCDAPLNVRPIEYTAYTQTDGEGPIGSRKVKKQVLDIPMKYGTTVVMQIDNWKDVQEGKAEFYNLKTLYAIKAQRFGPHIKGQKLQYAGSELDRACGEFYNDLAPAVQKDVCTVVITQNPDRSWLIGGSYITETVLPDGTRIANTSSQFTIDKGVENEQWREAYRREQAAKNQPAIDATIETPEAPETPAQKGILTRIKNKLRGRTDPEKPIPLKRVL